jgi:hypothetical protein
MPHINHRRGDTRRRAFDYPWDLRGWKPGRFRTFRVAERFALERVRAGADPDTTIFPDRCRDNDDGYWL